MSWTPTRLWNGNLSGSGNITVYTVPAGTQAVLTNWTISPTANITSMSAYLFSNLVTSGGAVALNKPMSPLQQYLYQGWYVLDPGDTVVWNAANVFESGYAWQMAGGISGPSGTAIAGVGTPFKAYGTVSTTNDVGLYTVPAGKTAIVKTVVVANTWTGSQYYGVKIGAVNNASASTPITPWNSPLAAGAVYQVDGAFIAQAGESIVVHNWTGSGNITYHAHGVLV